MAGERVRIAILPDEIINKNTGRLNDGQTREYSQSVRNAGGIPYIVSCTAVPEEVREIYDDNDGFVLSGGLDLNPPEGEEVLATDNPGSHENDSMFRQVLELALWSPEPKPVLAICRGMQALNTALGGTLERHLPDLGRDHHKEHLVIVKDGTILSTAVGGVDKLMVNSRHHQAIKDLGKSLVVAAWAEDGTPEAVEFEDMERFIVGSQWHDEELGGRLFFPFVQAAARAKERQQHLRLAA